MLGRYRVIVCLISFLLCLSATGPGVAQEPRQQFGTRVPQPAAFVSGFNRIVVYQTQIVRGEADYGLAATPGTLWVVSVLDITNFGIEAQTISLADFQYVVDDEGTPVAADLSQGASAQLGFTDVQADGSVAVPVDSTVRMAVAFPLPDVPATEPIPRIVFGDEQVNVASTTVPSLDVTVLSPVQPWVGAQGAVQTVPGNGTIEVGIADTVETVSLAGVVTPPVDGCFGAEASAAVLSLSGGTVWVEDDPTSDGSLVWYWDDGRGHLVLLNQALVEQGFGAYDDESGTAYAAWLAVKSQTAETSETGLWSTCEGAGGER